MSEINNIIDFKNTSASYGNENVLQNISFSVKEGEFIVIIGSSGCGKTTLLKMINGLVTPLQGEVFVEGESLKSCDIIAQRRRIGYAVQGAKLFPHMTVENNICYVPSLDHRMEKEEKRKLAEEMLELVQLPPELGSRFPRQLSGGQQQRVGIARALAFKPKILLMDEPFGAVDEITRRGLQEELRTLHQKTNVTIIFITHDIREAMNLGSRIVIMKDGQILQEGTADELIHNPKDEFVTLLFQKCDKCEECEE